VNPALLTTTDAVDPVFIFIYAACLVLFLGIALTMGFFVYRYHRSRAPLPTSQTASNIWLEIVWTALPTLLVLAMFWYGWKEYLFLQTSPKGAMAITATARTWSWSFSYPNGKTSTKLYVPVGVPVTVDLVSNDVNHGFFIPAFRVKRDIIPGMKTKAWFIADRPGSFDLFCSQYCGKGHSAMVTTVEALPDKAFTAWLQQEAATGAAAAIDGKKLAADRGCLACHSLDGKPGVGPTFKGIMGRQETVVTGGKERSITVDEEYLRKSIREPNADIVKGFQPIMPAYGDLSPGEQSALVEFLKGAH
jgi:cytochrome c oxidase subunit 2